MRGFAFRLAFAMLPLLAAGGRMGVLAGSTVRFGFITFIFHDYSPLFMMGLSRQRPDISKRGHFLMETGKWMRAYARRIG